MTQKRRKDLIKRCDFRVINFRIDTLLKMIFAQSFIFDSLLFGPFRYRFYYKYTEAYGIPVVSSNRVSDKALRRACHITRFLFADRYDLRNSFYKNEGRFAVIAIQERMYILLEKALWSLHFCLYTPMDDIFINPQMHDE